MEIPLIHMNGSGLEHLREQWAAAADAIRQAQEMVGRAAPHMRDFYPYPDGQERFERARNEHHARFMALQTVLDEYKHLYRQALKQSKGEDPYVVELSNQ